MRRRGLKRRVAVLFDSIEDDYQASILRGIVDESSVTHVTLWCFAGGVLAKDPGSPARDKNFLFDLFDPDLVDGILLLSGSLSTHLGVEGFGAWVKRFGGKPLVHLGIPLPEANSVIVEGRTSSGELVEHLIQKHGKRTIAFIRGPEASQEAEERYEAYRGALDKAGITFDPRWVVSGNWHREAGAEAIRELDARGVSLRGDGALVAANDYMALGALEELRSRGFSVPSDVVVCGFDDIVLAREATPPLTTVRQPTEKLGQEGLRRLVALMNQSLPPSELHLPAELILRSSCGCRRSDSPASTTRSSSTSSLRASLVERRVLLGAELARAARGTFSGVGAGWEERLLQALLADLAQETSSSFTAALEKLIARLPPVNHELETLHAVLDVFRDAIHTSSMSDPLAVKLGNEALDSARRLVGDSLVRFRSKKNGETVSVLRTFTRLVTSLLWTGELESVREIWETELRALGFTSFSLGVFPEPGQPSPECRTLVAYGKFTGPATAATFSSRELAPAELFDGEEAPLLVQPLVSAGRPLGLVTFSWGPLEGPVYEGIRELLSLGAQSHSLGRGVGALDRTRELP